MEYRGVSLKEALNEKKLSNKEKLEITKQILEILQELIRLKVNHNDLRLDNIVVTEKNGKPFVSIIDFDLSSLAEPSETIPAKYHHKASILSGMWPGLTYQDCFGVAISLIELVTGEIMKNENKQILQQGEDIQKDKYLHDTLDPIGLSSFVPFLYDMLNISPEDSSHQKNLEDFIQKLGQEITRPENPKSP